MTNEAWEKHIEETELALRPSRGGNAEYWKLAVNSHKENGCQVCKARTKTRKASKARKDS